MKRFFKKLKQGLEKTRKVFTAGIKELFSIGRKIDDDFKEELYARLVQADMGPVVATHIVDRVEDAYRNREVDEQLTEFVKTELKSLLTEDDNALRLTESGPTVIMVAGVNGAGKTTSIAKLAQLCRDQGKEVMLCASDTFRAAAVDQLTIWAERVGVDIVQHGMGSDPAAVAHDACEAAVARNKDVLIVDTAGRLHTQDNLMRELEKIHRVVSRQIEGAPHEVVLVLDATTGQNAIQQAEMFRKAVNVTGIFLAKLDGTAKGGVVVSIKKAIDLPVKFIGVGEKPEDIEVFDPDAFVEALFE